MGVYLKAGVCGFGISSSLVNRKLIEAGNYDAITELAKKYVAVIENG
jgi:2-keto-3-deoxy-6-phosphogluconate aldolase